MTLADEDALSEVVDIGAYIDNDIEKSVAIVDNSIPQFGDRLTFFGHSLDYGW